MCILLASPMFIGSFVIHSKWYFIITIILLQKMGVTPFRPMQTVKVLILSTFWSIQSDWFFKKNSMDIYIWYNMQNRCLHCFTIQRVKSFLFRTLDQDLNIIRRLFLFRIRKKSNYRGSLQNEISLYHQASF